MDIIWENRDRNLLKAADLIKQASVDNCDVAVLPEMFSTGFSMNTKKICEDINGKTVCELKKMAVSNNINIIAGVAIKVENHYENRAFVIDRNGLIVSQYTKNYSFSYSGE
ncbi:MAG: carbon-nitrogen family hydrolase, partial [Deltaproteobacteria bacterium]|nr:carbon-nitrogen family hydrolase [Deltaproteobacteria bacterium]